MNVAILLYLVNIVDNASSLLTMTIIFIISAMVVTAFFAAIGDYDCNHNWTYFKLIYNKVWIAIVASILLVAIPSKQTMYMMLGAAYLQNSSIPQKVSQVIDLKLDDVIEELKHKDKK